MPYTCPICAYDHLKEPPRSKSGGGSYEICPSCGFQFGVDDDDRGISFEQWRHDWQKKGRPWSSQSIAPPASKKKPTKPAAKKSAFSKPRAKRKRP